MRENRLSGSEGGAALVVPTPIFHWVPPGRVLSTSVRSPMLTRKRQRRTEEGASRCSNHG
jgi:hypothetical protein